MDLGGVVLESEPSAIDTFVAAFDDAGLHQWSHRFGQTQLRSLGRGPGGETYLFGSFLESIDFGPGPMVSAGGSDLFLAAFDKSGTLVSQRAWGDGSPQEGLAVNGTSTGKAILAGNFAGALEVGGVVLTSAGGRDVFVAKVTP
jgi:hypothetical protein